MKWKCTLCLGHEEDTIESTREFETLKELLMELMKLPVMTMKNVPVEITIKPGD